MRMIYLMLLLTATALPAQPTLDESDPLIASVIAYSQAYSIERWETFCAREYPETEQSISAARSEWLEQHADLIDKVSRILQSEYTKDERTSIAVQAKLANNEFEDRLASAPTQERKQWCQESPMRIADQRMSLLERPVLVDAIMEFEIE